MGKWSEKLSEIPPRTELTKLTKGGFDGFVSSQPRHILKNRSLEDAEPETTYQGFTLADLETEAHPDEWDEVKDNPEILKVFALSLLEGRQMAACVTPERFTKLARCQGCGDVMVPADWQTERVTHELGLYACETVYECPTCTWCRLRHQGKNYPKPCPTDRDGKTWTRPIAWQGVDERPEQPESTNDH